MIKSIAVVLWVCAMTVGGLYVAHFGAEGLKSGDDLPVAQSELIRTKMIAVPVMRDGVVVGYFLSRLEYEIDGRAVQHELPADSLLRHALHVAVNELQSADLQSVSEIDKRNIEKIVSEQVAQYLGSKAAVIVKVAETDFLLRSDS